MYYKKFAAALLALGFSLSSWGIGQKLEMAEETKWREEPRVETSTDDFDVQSFIYPEKEVKKIKITAVGDLMVHQWQLDDAKNGSEYDFSHNFQMVEKYLSGADFTAGNLETVLGGAEIGYSDYPMFNTPDSFAQAIKQAGFDFLTTANNHCLDKRESGLLRTLDTLDALEILPTGTYRSQDERQSYVIADINGISAAFLSYTYSTNGIPIPSGKDYLVNMLDEELIIQDLAEIKKLEPDIIIIMPHMGDEYQPYPRQAFKNWADMMIDYGADIVLASHPHVLQPMEIVEKEDGGEGFVIYSLGNFISSQRTTPRDEGIILNLEISKQEGSKAQIDKISFIPTWVQFRNQAGQNYIRTLSVHDALKDYENGIQNELRPADIQRLKAVHKEVTSIYLAEAPDLENIQNEYTFYERAPKD